MWPFKLTRWRGARASSLGTSVSLIAAEAESRLESIWPRRPGCRPAEPSARDRSRRLRSWNALDRDPRGFEVLYRARDERFGPSTTDRSSVVQRPSHGACLRAVEVARTEQGQPHVFLVGRRDCLDLGVAPHAMASVSTFCCFTIRWRTRSKVRIGTEPPYSRCLADALTM